MAQVVPLLLLSASVMSLTSSHRQQLERRRLSSRCALSSVAVSAHGRSSRRNSPRRTSRRTNSITSCPLVRRSVRPGVERVSSCGSNGKSLPARAPGRISVLISISSTRTFSRCPTARSISSRGMPTSRTRISIAPIWAADYLSTRSTGADAVWQSLGYTGKASAWRSSIQASPTGTTTSRTRSQGTALRTAISASARSSISSTAKSSRTTTTVTARTWRASFSATDTTLKASSRAWRPTRTSSR